MAGIAGAGGFTKTAADGVLKDVYLGPVNYLINQRAALLNRIERDTKNVSGREARVPIQTAVNEHVLSLGRGGQLPDPDSQEYKYLAIGTQYFYGRIKLEGPLIADMKDDVGSFVRAVESEMKGLGKTASSKLNQQLWGKGDGIRALVDGNPAVNAATFNVKSYWGLWPNYSFAKATLALRKNMRITFTRAGVFVAGATGHKITAVTPTGGTYGSITIVTPTTGIDLADGDEIVACSHDAMTSGNLAKDSEAGNALIGLGLFVDDAGTYLGINPATDDIWKAIVLDNGGTARPLDEDLLQEFVDEVEQKGNGDGATGFFSSYGLRRQYVALLRADRRYSGTTSVKNVTGGMTFTNVAVMYQGGSREIPWFVDKDAPKGILVGLDEPSVSWYEKKAWDWMDYDGSILVRLTDIDAVQATLMKYSAIATGSRNNNGRIEDLSE